VPELVYVGNHGLELSEAADAWRETLGALTQAVAWPHLEDKGLTASFHYRGLDEDTVMPQLEAIADRARAAGLTARFGRKLLEVVPPVPANKGTAVRSLLDRYGLERALAAGDDVTDLDSFGALAGLKVAVRVAVASDEGPVSLRDAADIVVADTIEFLALLRRL
jgi:trehalose 6-phosphate phosphatase